MKSVIMKNNLVETFTYLFESVYIVQSRQNTATFFSQKGEQIWVQVEGSVRSEYLIGLPLSYLLPIFFFSSFQFWMICLNCPSLFFIKEVFIGI